ncbi:MAG: 4'-phosphopantetheinyl transferase superfamily protein [Candidatus Poseidoniaceae archaeon]|nr:4'-phosphopantetheinyl transferase superfamily protein [Candidatus Poseidoniaceae archaeon]MBL6889490.1 4'-phosphopantetheinyl transferase superfamily protein [Candidatus Poseidoniaceae archaeon]
MDVKFDFIELEHNARLLVATCRVRPIDPTTLTLIDWDEIRTFRTDKRKDEHLSARWLLEQALGEWGLNDLTALMISRTEERAPYLNVIHGMWIQYSLPSISISHSDGLACVALIDEGWTVGLDAEPLNRPPKPAVFDMMAKGEELERLNAGKIDSLLAWTGKEAIQKALRMGMHFNPREIEIPIGDLESEISIGNSKIQLRNFLHPTHKIMLAYGKDSTPIRSPEEALLEATRDAMDSGASWGVGCSTTRNNS